MVKQLKVFVNERHCLQFKSIKSIFLPE